MTQETLQPRKRRGPLPTGKGVPIQVRLSADVLGRLDEFIATEPQPKPSRPEAIRRALSSWLARRVQRTDEPGSGLSENDRATPMGLFQFGEAYLEGAALLSNSLMQSGHSRSVVSHLYFHSAELYLKSFLRAKGRSIDNLKSKFGHDLARLARACKTAGLEIDDSTLEKLDEYVRLNDQSESKYFRSRAGEILDQTELAQTCFKLREAVLPIHAVTLPSRRMKGRVI